MITIRNILLTGMVLFVCCSAPPSDTDKTLVSWVDLDDPNVRGGSILTIQDEDRFDGIFLADEDEPLWLAGSEDFIRTREDNPAGPAMDSTGLDQVAIVYEGPEIRIYINGELETSYTADNIDLLNSETNFVVLGQSHLGGDWGISGAIEDARIYSTALSADELKKLVPNESSDIEPYAWWDFEGEELIDRTGRYANNRKGEYDQAILENGKLYLKKWGYMVATREYVQHTPAWPEDPPGNWPTFHLAHPGPGIAEPGDPNAAFFYKGRYHLHYIYHIPEGFSFAHLSSEDLVYWKWHPTVLTPPFTGHGMFSGTGFFTREGQPVIIYHGFGSGYNQLVFALDDNLDEWTKPIPIKPVNENGEKAGFEDHWDPDCWLMNDTYYAISGGRDPELMKSTDLKNWLHLGKLLHEDYPEGLGPSRKEDISCANMFKIGNKWMLLCISHRLGCRYFLGDFINEKYLPDFHALMQWHDEEETLNFFAPESLLTPDGRRVMWAWIISDNEPSGIQSLPRELELPDDGKLRIRPLKELEKLRYEEWITGDITVTKDEPLHLDEISGDALEIKVVFATPVSGEYGIVLLPDDRMKITAGAGRKVLTVGTINPPFELSKGENLTLRIFIDKKILEVFANDRQAAVHTHEDLMGDIDISLFTKDRDVVVKELKIWKIKSIYQPDVE